MKTDLLLIPMSARYRDMRAAAVAAEEAGFDGGWTWDHLRDPHADSRPGGPGAWTGPTAPALVGALGVLEARAPAADHRRRLRPAHGGHRRPTWRWLQHAGDASPPRRPRASGARRAHEVGTGRRPLHRHSVRRTGRALAPLGLTRPADPRPRRRRAADPTRRTPIRSVSNPGSRPPARRDRRRPALGPSSARTLDAPRARVGRVAQGTAPPASRGLKP